MISEMDSTDTNISISQQFLSDINLLTAWKNVRLEYCAKQFVLPSKRVHVTKHSDQVQVLLLTEQCDRNLSKKQNSCHHRQVKTG